MTPAYRKYRLVRAMAAYDRQAGHFETAVELERLADRLAVQFALGGTP